MIEIALAIGIMIYSSEIEQCVCMKRCDVSHKNPGLVLVTLTRVVLHKRKVIYNKATSMAKCLSMLSTTPYHQAANGLVKRWNQTIKNMLKRMIHDEFDSWDRLLPYVLFAYREVPEVSIGLSSFELVCGWPVRGPLSVVMEAWVDKEDSGNLIDYVVQTRSTLMTSVEMAQENLLDSQAKMKAWYDQKAREQSFEVGEEVLLLLPTS